jgi:hypothetical protein
METPTGSSKQAICLGLSAATGGFLAILSDIWQKQDASAVEQLKGALAGVLGVSAYPAAVALILIGLSVALSFIFSADSNKKAFYTGASILAIMMTVVPYNAKPSIPTSPESVGPLTEGEAGWWDRQMIAPRVLAQAPQAGATQPVTVHLESTDKKALGAVVYSLVDPGSGEVIARSRVLGNDFSFYAANRPYLLRVQVEGYAIAEKPFSPGQRSLSISLMPSGVPLAVQRLFRR